MRLYAASPANLTTVTGRPLQVAVLPPGGRLGELLAAALDGTGPALAPVDPGLPPDRLRRLIQILAPRAVTAADGVTRLPGGRPTSDETAVVIVTSGSTGEPKAAELGGAALVASASASLRRIGAGSGERWLCCLPTWHIAGVQVLVRSLLTGTTPHVCPPSDISAIASAAQAGCAHAALVPTQLRRLLDHGMPGAAAGAPQRSLPPRVRAVRERTALSGLRTILLGGAAAPRGLIAEARAAGARVITTYGMTETCGGCVYDGVPLDGVEVRTGEAGRIHIAGPVLMSGYRLRPDLTAAAFDGRWFITSDLGRIDGGRLAVRGRADDVITTGGEKVVAGEVAAAVEAHEAVREAAVFAVPDPEWGERVTVAVVPADRAAPPSLPQLRAHVAGCMPAHAAPQELLIVGEIPLLPAGKPDIPALRALLREQSGAGSVSK